MENLPPPFEFLFLPLWTGQAQIQRTEPLVIGLVNIQLDPIVSTGVQFPAACDGLGACSAEGQGLGGGVAAVAECQIIGHRTGAVGFDVCLVIEGLRACAADGGMFCRQGHLRHCKRGGTHLELHPELRKIDSLVVLQFEESLVGSRGAGRFEIVGDVHHLPRRGAVGQLGGARSADIVTAVVHHFVG